jgi:hypothetical protein
MSSVEQLITSQDEADELVARLQKAGHGARALPDGGWLVHRWGMSVHLPDLAALRRFAHNVLGGTKNV